MSEHERTGWRDEAISKRHRAWGFNCPGADIDFLCVEYSVGKPVALVEYKHERAAMPNFEHPTYHALRSLANAANVPFMVAMYSNTDWWFCVYPMNAKAKESYRPCQMMSEFEYVNSLYRLRHLVIEDVVLRKLNRARPVVDIEEEPSHERA